MLNSEVIGSIFRLFRKTIQVLTNESSNLLDLKKLNIHPKEFASKFRVRKNLYKFHSNKFLTLNLKIY
jgi:hypothetical protein